MISIHADDITREGSREEFKLPGAPEERGVQYTSRLGTLGGGRCGIWNVHEGTLLGKMASEVFVVLSGLGEIKVGAAEAVPIGPGAVVRTAHQQYAEWTNHSSLTKFFFATDSEQGYSKISTDAVARAVEAEGKALGAFSNVDYGTSTLAQGEYALIEPRRIYALCVLEGSGRLISATDDQELTAGKAILLGPGEAVRISSIQSLRYFYVSEH